MAIIKCTSCQADNPAQAKFCEQCGTPLERRCPKCGASTSPGARFCGSCGQRLESATSPTRPSPAAPAPPEISTHDIPNHLAQKIRSERAALQGERRQVTVLFGDIANFTAMSEKLDPEEVGTIIQQCFKLVTAEIHRFEGTINQYGGDGLMALFGAPIAHEDAPRRAVHAALAIQRALADFSKRLREERAIDLQMRIALNTGIVVVGRIGDDLRMEYTAIGDTINLASRLQSAARPGSVIISEATHKAVAGFFETADLGALEIKGHAPARAFEVRALRGRRARLEVAVERGLTPYVGREREIETLEDLFRLAKQRQGQVAFIAGEAGIGKSRMLLELQRRLAEAGERFTWLEGRCVSFGASIPMLPVIDQLRENFGIEEIAREPEIIAKIERGMRAIGGMEAETPYIRYLLAVDPGDPAIIAMDASARRARVFNALRNLLLRGAGIQPIVLVVEDLHWMDTSTKEFLDFIMDSVAGAAIMLILTHRVGQAPAFASRSFHSMLNLRHLSEGQTFEMAARVLGAERLPEQLKSALLLKAEGIPLFVEEVTRTLVELGFLVRTDGGYAMAKGVDEMTVPDTIQGIIMARLDRLGAEGKRTVQLASVIGRQFIVRLLERVADLSGKLEGLLAELKALEIIYEQGMLPEPAYIFKHAVIQDVAYNSLLIQRRKELHRAVGGAIEELFKDRLTEHYAELAHHFTRGEDWARAIEYCRLAGDQAAHAFASAEAEQHYARALEAAERLPLSDLRLLGELHQRHGAVLNDLNRHEEAIVEHERALEVARQLGDRRRECEILIGLCHVGYYYHRPALSEQHIQKALVIAQELGDRDLQASCLANRAQGIAVVSGPTAEAISNIEDAARLSAGINDPALIAEINTWVGAVLQWRGDLDRAVGHLHRAIESARTTHRGFLLSQSVYWLGHACLSRGEYEDSLNWYRQLSEYANGSSDRFYLARSPNCLGGVHLEIYDLDEALRLNLEGAEAAARYTRWPEPRGHSLLKAGLAYLWRGEVSRAEETLGRAWSLLESDVWGRWRWYIPLLRARGELALAQGRHDEALQFATQSLEMATNTNSRKHIARAQWLQGEALAAGGHLHEAARVLEASATLAEHLKMPREIWMARAALGRVLIKTAEDGAAEAQFTAAAKVIESIAARLRTPHLRDRFLAAEPVRSVFKILSRDPAVPS